MFVNKQSLRIEAAAPELSLAKMVARAREGAQHLQQRNAAEAVEVAVCTAVVLVVEGVRVHAAAVVVAAVRRISRTCSQARALRAASIPAVVL